MAELRMQRAAGSGNNIGFQLQVLVVSKQLRP
jgi:hypothetical protein